MQPLWEVADLMRSIRRRMRFGEFSRAPLSVLRLEVRGHTAECDWMVRPPDVWDSSLRRVERERNESQQALADAMTMRELVFGELPNVESATLCAFRPSAAREPPELIITGLTAREPPAVWRVSSPVMRAKLYGLRFELIEGVLQPLESLDHSHTKAFQQLHLTA